MLKEPTIFTHYLIVKIYMDLLAFSVFSSRNMGLIYEGIKYKSTNFFLKKKHGKAYNTVIHIVHLCG